MKWILENLQLIIFVIVLLSMVHAAIRAAKNKAGGAEEKQELPGDLEEEARRREIQARIRRKIAERRGGAGAPVAPPAGFAPDEPRPPVMAPRPEEDPFDPFGDPVPREVFRRAMPRPEPPPVAPVAMDLAMLARQEQMADQLRQLEAERLANERRVVRLASETAATTAAYAPAKARVGWLADLRKADNLRRAVVLRELLGPPVGLR